ncbi:MAG: lyase [Acidimicrobiales bacterium]
MTDLRRRGNMAAAVILSIALVAASCSGEGDDAVVDAPTTPSTATTEVDGQASVPSISARVPEETLNPDSTARSSPELQPIPADEMEIVSFPVPEGSRPHDVAPAIDGGVWYTAQRAEALGYLDPLTGETRHIPLGAGSAPHGVIVDADGLAWVTDGGLNAIVSVDPVDDDVSVYPLPAGSPNANLNTAAFDDGGILWFTGQNGVYGRLDPSVGEVEVFDAPRGRGPYGIAATPDGDIYFASLAGSYVGAVSPDGAVDELDPPTAGQGARRVWSDSVGTIWVSEWNSGQLSRYIPDTGEWAEWGLPGPDPSAYAVYVDEFDQVWVSDFNGNALHRFDPVTESFDTFPLPAQPSNVRQILGRPGEIWGAESANDSLVVVRAAG